MGVINTRLQECLSGHTVIRSHGCQERFLLWFGARHLRAPLASVVTVGTLVAFVQLVGRMFGPITSLSEEFQTIQRAMTGIERIGEVLEEPPEVRLSRAHAGARSRDGCLEIRGIGFGYLPDRPVLHDVSLTIESGQRVVIAGRTGAGKTSLLHLMPGLYQPWSGNITVSGMSPSALQTAHLGPLVERLPLGLDTPLGQGNQQLSHGETQLLSLARALVGDPPVLLLDEPSSGLDSETERTVFEALRDAGHGRTTITISHRLNNLVEADRMIILSRGRIVQDGEPASLSGEAGLYDALQELEQLGWVGETGA